MIPVLNDVLRWPACACLLLLVVLAGCATGCARGEPDPELDVVASVYPLAWAAERVAAGSIDDVVNLTPPGAEPHDVELSPRDVETVRAAELVVYLGGGFQPALEDAVDSRDGRSLDLLEGEEDPHVWLDPLRFARAVSASRGGSVARVPPPTRSDSSKTWIPSTGAASPTAIAA